MPILEISEPAVLEKLQHLPAEKRAEVVDFIDFLLARNQEDGVRLAVAQLNSAAFTSFPRAAWECRFAALRQGWADDGK